MEKEEEEDKKTMGSQQRSQLSGQFIDI